MAQYLPHQISTQLCWLFDSGRCTVDQFAKLVEEPRDLIVRVTNNPGAKITPELRLRMGRILASWHRQYPETKPPTQYEFEQRRNLRLVTEAAAANGREGTPRGVFEDRDCFPAVRAFTVIDSKGQCLMRVEMAASLATPAFEQRLVRWLNKADPIGESVKAT